MQTTLGDVARDKLDAPGKASLLLGLNQNHLIAVAAGAKLKVPGTKDADAKPFQMPADGTLTGATYLALASQQFLVPEKAPGLEGGGSAAGPTIVFAIVDISAKSQEVYELNKADLEPPTTLPAGTRLKIPQQTWPALVAFGALTLLLLLVGLGFLFRAPEKKVAGK